MLLSSVILVLQETLEAVLLIGVLLAISYQLRRNITWLVWGLGVGIPFAYLYASHMGDISVWFDYVGQEVVNASLMSAITPVTALYAWSLFKGRQPGTQVGQVNQHQRTAALTLYASGIVALAITREGAEAVLYLGGFFQQKEHFQSVMIGSFIGFSIGMGVGVLLLYGLLGLPEKWRLRAPVILLALIAGNMLSQATLQLTQADWIASAQPLWDSSGWIAENTITGQLLYALVGYEATPSGLQIINYIAGTALVLASAILGKLPLSRQNLLINKQ